MGLPNSADLLVRNAFAIRGRHHIDVPVDVGRGPTVVCINTGDRVTCLDYQTGNVYQLDLKKYTTVEEMRRAFTTNEHHHVDVPIDVSKGPAIVSINTGDSVTCYDTETSSVYTVDPVDYEVTGSTDSHVGNKLSMGPVIYWNSNAINKVPFSIQPVQEDTAMYGASDGTATFSQWAPRPYQHSNMMDIDGEDYRSFLHDRTSPGQMLLPYNKDPRTNGGLHIIPRRDIVPGPQMPTPTKLNADHTFHDKLYLSLQEDVLPRGASPVDDYLNDHREARVRMYLDAAIGNQGCHCECSNLDMYLKANQDNVSAVALRATLSDECKKHVYLPSDSKSLANKLQMMQGAVDTWTKFLQEAREKQLPDTVNPWRSYNEGEDSMDFNIK